MGRPGPGLLRTIMFADLDRNLREMGAGDLGVGKRVKKHGAQFVRPHRSLRGSLAAMEGGLDERSGAQPLRHDGEPGEDADRSRDDYRREIDIDSISTRRT